MNRTEWYFCDYNTLSAFSSHYHPARIGDHSLRQYRRWQPGLARSQNGPCLPYTAGHWKMSSWFCKYATMVKSAGSVMPLLHELVMFITPHFVMATMMNFHFQPFDHHRSSPCPCRKFHRYDWDRAYEMSGPRQLLTGFAAAYTMPR